MHGSAQVLCAAFGAVGLVTGLAIAGDPAPPAGPVAGTMKTLDEVEPRTPVGSATTPGNLSATYVISAPGSYFLTGNISGQAGKDGVRIDAPNVTLDLNGFTVDGGGVGAFGISANVAATGAVVRNGQATGWVDGGVDCGLAESSLIQDVTSTSNTGWGIRSGQNGRVVNCASQFNGLAGFIVVLNGMAIGCTAADNGDDGFQTGNYVVLSECRSADNVGDGFSVGAYGSVSNCTSRDNMIDGFVLSSSAVAANCTSTGNGVDGFQLGFGASARDCSSSLNGADGFEMGTATSATNCTARSNSNSGFRTGSGSSVIDCNASFNAEHGVSCGADTLVRGGIMHANGGAIVDGSGVFVDGVRSRVEGVHATLNDNGVRTLIAGSLFIGNSASGNSGVDMAVFFGINGPTILVDPTDEALGNFDF